MKRQLLMVQVLVLFWISGCADMVGNEIRLEEKPVANQQAKYAATIRIKDYADERSGSPARKIGINKSRVVGLSTNEVVLDRDVPVAVRASLRKHLQETGIQIAEATDENAQFDLTGVIKEFSYDVKERDFVNLRIVSTLTEVATGKVVWSGEVSEKNERFAGVSGNNKGDIADYLRKELGVVTGKTAEAVSTTLMAVHPELFNITPGTKPIKGVEVFVAPNLQGSPAPETALQRPLNATQGTLVIRSEPARAKIYVDGVYYGLTPMNVDAAAGIREVEVRLKGYRNATEKVAVRVGALTELEFSLEK